MRFVIQRVSEAQVTIEGRVKGKIGPGFVVLVGVGTEDDRAVAEKMVRKMLHLRIFADGAGKTNLDIGAVGGSLLLISQFTLYADMRHGNRPGFTLAAPPELANSLYEHVVELCRREVPIVETGEFGADMKVRLLNDGPFSVELVSGQPR